MIHLVKDLKDQLVLRKHNELKNMEELAPGTDRDLLLLSAGKIAELDRLIASLDDMIQYYEKAKTLSDENICHVA
jgi:hypothetical protein